jgi:hypothetical protein
MTLKINRTRMAMPGEFYAYDCLVPTKQLDRSKFSYFVIDEGVECVTFADATCPQELHDMPLGWDRYEAWKAHEKQAQAIAWGHIQRAFPETQGRAMAELWLEIPGFDERHATVEVEA